jgi:hypothetical protein
MSEPLPHPFLRSTSTAWVAFVLQVLVLVVVTLIVADGSSELPALLPVALAASVGVAAIVGVRAMERLLTASSPDGVDDAMQLIRSRSTVQWAIADAPVILSAVLAFVLGPPAVVLVGAVGSIWALVLARPSMMRIERVEKAWHEEGSRVRLVRHLQRGERSGR